MIKPLFIDMFATYPVCPHHTPCLSPAAIAGPRPHLTRQQALDAPNQDRFLCRSTVEHQTKSQKCWLVVDLPL